MNLKLKDERYKNVRLIFNEEGHKYTDNFGNEYKSTTTILHDYQPSFDKNYWLKKKAKELNISTKELAKQWDKIRDEACDRGTKTHNNLEDGIKSSSKFKDAIRYIQPKNGEMITIADIPDINRNVKELDIKQFIDITENKYQEIYNVFEYYKNNGYKIYSEIGGFLIDYLISGTIDVLCIREDQFVIGDWKTNRDGLKFESGYYKKDKTQKPYQDTNIWIGKKENLLPPVSGMPNCNGSIYNLQLSMYAAMVQIILGIPCAGLWLAHIDSDFILNEYGMPKKFNDGTFKLNENPKEKITLHKMIYRYKEIQAILNDRKKVLKANEINSQFSLDL